MSPSPPAGIAAPPAAFVLGIAAIYLFVPIVIGEAIVLGLLRRAGSLRSFIAAPVMSLASALVGAIVLYLSALTSAGAVGQALPISLLPLPAPPIAIEGGVAVKSPVHGGFRGPPSWPPPPL